jgi:ClpP class serine protease
MGKEALDMGLIDYLGNAERALEVASELAGARLKTDYAKIGHEKESLGTKLLKRMI